VTNRIELRIMCTMHVWIVAFGKTASIASGKLFRPSQQRIRMSKTPRFLTSVRIFSQNFAPSVSSSQSPRTSLFPAMFTPMARYADLFVTVPGRAP
jgi:hypothetical protein